jgi:hypothetical protein
VIAKSIEERCNKEQANGTKEMAKRIFFLKKDE